MGRKEENRHTTRFQRRLRRLFTNPFTYVGICIAIAIVVATWVVHETETLTDSGITGWFDTIWHTIVAVSAAYFDFYVKSVPGRFASLVLLLFGMIIFSFVTGRVTSGFMNMLMKRNKGLKKLRGMKGHVIICGWRPGFDKILDAVMRADPNLPSDMIVMINEAPADQMEQLQSEIRFKDVRYVAGDFADAEVLKRGFIEKAARVLVISDASKERSEMETDSQTVLAVLTMKNLNPSVYVAAEIIDRKFQEHLQLARCDEILLTQEYEHSLLATASSGMGYSNVIKSLISDDSGSGIVIEAVPAAFTGKTYGELSASEHSADAVLVGLLLDGGHRTVLTPDDAFVIPEKAKTIHICGNR